MEVKGKTREQLERYMLYLKTKGGVTIPMFRKRRTWFMCHRIKQKLENEFTDWNGHFIINH